MMTKHIPLLLLASTSLNAFADTSEDSWSFSTGATYTSGDYNSSETTEFYYIPVSARYTTGKWKFKVTVPYIKMKGPQNVIRDIGLVTQSTTTTNKTVEGLGDVIASATYQFLYLPQYKTIFDVTGKIKFGTADESKNLGTGKNDYTLMLGTYKLMGDFTPYATFGRRFYGDSANIQLDNVYLGSVGVMYKWSETTSIGIDYYAKQKTASHRHATQQASAFASYKIDKNWKLQGYLIEGLSANTPDFGMGFSLGYQLD